MAKEPETRVERDDEQLEENENEMEWRLKKLVRDTIDYYKMYIFPEAFEIVKAKVLFTWDLKVLLQTTGNEHRSCSYYPLIASTHDTFFSNTYDIIPQMRVIAQQPEDIEKAGMWQDFIDWAWSVWNATDANEEMLDEATLLGLSSWQVAFQKKDSDILYRVTDWENERDEKISCSDARPSIEHVPFFELFIDPASSDFYDARFKFRRKIKSWGSVLHWYSSFIPDLEDMKDKILTDGNYISEFDFNKIWEIRWHSSVYVSEFIKQIDSGSTALSPEVIVYQNIFKIDTDDEKVEVIEYWSKDELKVMMNGRLIYDWPTIYPISWDPFVHIYLEKLPWSIRCRGVGHKLMPHQKQINTHWNAIQDAINMHLRPMYVVENGVLKGHDGKAPQKITYKDWATLVSHAPWVQNWGLRPIEFIDYNMIAISRNLIKELLEEAREIIWVNSYTQWGQGKVERSPTAVRAKTQIISSRLQQLMSSMNRMQQKAFEFWLAMAHIWKGEEFNVRIFKENTEEVKYSTVTPKDIINKFDIIVENGEDRLATKQERLGQTIQLLQILTPYITELVAEGVVVNRINFADIILEVLNTLDFKWLEVASEEDLKEQIKEKVELAMYHQSLIQWWPAEPWAEWPMLWEVAWEADLSGLEGLVWDPENPMFNYELEEV